MGEGGSLAECFIGVVPYWKCPEQNLKGSGRGLKREANNGFL